MLRNYFVTAFRSLVKNSTFSIINIGGLALGLAAFLFIIHYVQFERSYENAHVNAPDIFRVTLDLYNGAEFIDTDCETYPTIGPQLKASLPEVRDYIRMFSGDGLLNIKVGENRFLEDGIYFSDPSVFRIFTLDVVAGHSEVALNSPMQAVLTHSLAIKYFGHTNIIGESIEIDTELYKITAVIKDLAPNTHLKYRILLSHASLSKIYDWYSEESWDSNNEYTYLLMAPGTDITSFNKKLAAYVESLGDKLEDEQLNAEYIQDIHLYSNKSYEPESNGNARTVNFLFIIALIVLIIAWVNYINLATARAMERAREVGIRKVMGSARWQLVFQFLSESIIVNLLAGFFALLLFQTFLPSFRVLTGQPLPVDFVGEGSFWMRFVLILLGGSFMAGFYPAMVLSSFQPASVLKGKFRTSTHGQRLRKGLVVFQFAATSILLASVITVYMQINHLRKADLGMNLEQTLVLRAPTLTADSAYHVAFQSLKNELLATPSVVSMARSGSVPGLSINELSSKSSVKRLDRQGESGSYNYYHHWMDADFVPTLGMKLLAGRNFESGVSNQDAVLINEEASEKLGFLNAEEAIGSKITFYTRDQGEPATIIGVISNFSQRSPKEQQIPMIFRYGDWAHYYALRIDGSNSEQTLSDIKHVWDQVFPGSTFHYFFLDEYYNQQYKSEVQFGRVVATFSLFIVVIACLGLFGLASYTIVQRTKEIGIRKIMGASVIQIVKLLSSDFVRIVLVAAIIALPIAFYVMQRWLSMFAMRIELSFWIFLLPVVVIGLIAGATISFQTVKSAMQNPVRSLRQE